jgi:hypothetical protein
MSSLVNRPCLVKVYRVSTGTSLDAWPMGFSSSPLPLSARFRPVNEKWWPEDGRSSCLLSALLLSPNREKRPRFFGAGFGSSCRPTSSKPSSGTRSVLSLGRPCCMDDRGVARERRTSRECLASIDRRASSDCRGYVSAVISVMGDRAEMSYSCERGTKNTAFVGETYERSPVRIEALARDVERLGLRQETSVVGGCG